MKKFLALASAISCAAFLSSCHDDGGDGEGNVASDFSDDVTVMNMPSMLTNLTGNLGVTPYLLSDGNISVFTFTEGSAEDNAIYNAFFGGNVTPVEPVEGEENASGEEGEEYVNYGEDEKSALTKDDFPALFAGFYGGFTPAYQAGDGTDDADTMIPADGIFHDSTLVANSGTLCKALFTKNLASPLAHITMKKAISLEVSATKIYADMAKAINGDAAAKNNVEAWSLEMLPKNTRIDAVVYGYVESFRVSKFKEALSALVNTGKDVAGGGTEIGRVTLLNVDENGKATCTMGWNKIKFSKKFYCGEVYLMVVDNKTGKSTDAYEISENLMGSCLVRKITFEGRSLF